MEWRPAMINIKDIIVEKTIKDGVELYKRI
jgi:hypothetical protein